MLAGVLCGLLAGAMWGTVFIAPKLLGEFSPIALAVGRYVTYGAIATLALAPNLRRVLAKLGPHGYVVLARQALAGSVVYYILLALGVRYAGVAPTSIIIGLLPLVTTWLGRKDKDALPLRRMRAPLVLMLASVVALNVDALLDAQTGHATASFAIGVLCATGALACWSWYAVDNARYLKSHPEFTSAQWSGLYGMATGVMALVLGLVAMLAFGENTPILSPDAGWFWACNIGLALVTSVIANHLWNVASRLVPISLTAQLGASETLFAIVYGIAFNGTRPKTSEMLAICFLALSIGLSVFAHRRQPPQP